MAARLFASRSELRVALRKRRFLAIIYFMSQEQKTILITGVAGFIGGALAKKILQTDGTAKVIGIDSLSDYYDVSLKKARLKLLSPYKSFLFKKANITDKKTLLRIFKKNRPDIVINLAAQAGVRYSIENPDAYVSSNIVGFYNILEVCRTYPVEHLVFASSSSVYGQNKKVPYSVDDKVDNPVSLYAATKKSDELFAHAYAVLYKIPVTGLRFFTVYGPMGRPDMAYFKFADKLAKGQPIQIYNNGDMMRDFTYIDDIVDGIIKVAQKAPAKNADGVPYKIYNIGNNKPESLLRFVEKLEECLIKEGVISGPGKKEFLPMQAGDVYQTFADITDLERDFGFRPKTALQDGLARFVEWYKGWNS